MEIYQQAQYKSLKSCLLCYPVNFKIEDKNNKYYNKINYDLLYSQYNKFINVLSDNNVQLKFIDLDNNASQQIFTQDIGFIIEDIFFISRMTNENRKIETQYAKKFALENNLRYYEMKNYIEGGDVIHYDNIVFIGLSSRTNIKACEEIETVLRKISSPIGVIPIKFDNSKMHLDTVFNILDKDSAVISPYVYDKVVIHKFIKNLYEISAEDADNLGTNYVYLGNKKLISSNKNVTAMLRGRGYEVEYINYSEVSKANGGLECSTMFLLRN